MANSSASKRVAIKSVDQLRRAIKKGINFFYIQLNYGIISAKHITIDRQGRFAIMNNVDGTYDYLTDKRMMNQNYTNIGKAMKLKAFFVDNR